MWLQSHWPKGIAAVGGQHHSAADSTMMVFPVLRSPAAGGVPAFILLPAISAAVITIAEKIVMLQCHGCRGLQHMLYIAASVCSAVREQM